MASTRRPGPAPILGQIIDRDVLRAPDPGPGVTPGFGGGSVPGRSGAAGQPGLSCSTGRAALASSQRARALITEEP
jgi:hypothetical protein